MCDLRTVGGSFGSVSGDSLVTHGSRIRGSDPTLGCGLRSLWVWPGLLTYRRAGHLTEVCGQAICL